MAEKSICLTDFCLLSSKNVDVHFFKIYKYNEFAKIYIPVIKTITERPKHKPWFNKLNEYINIYLALEHRVLICTALCDMSNAFDKV